MEFTSFRHWRRTFCIILGCFDLLGHIDANNPRPNDPAWVQADLTVLMWIHATLADDLMDMVMEDNPTAYSVWKQISDFFNANKSGCAVQLETEFHGLQQGNLFASEYCRLLKTLADALADCDQPLRGRFLVHQLVAGLNPRYNILKTMIPALPQFPTFIQARSLLLSEEAFQNKSKSPVASTESALVTTEGSDSAAGGSASRSNSGGDRSNTTGGVIVEVAPTILLVVVVAVDGGAVVVVIMVTVATSTTTALMVVAASSSSRRSGRHSIPPGCAPGGCLACTVDRDYQAWCEPTSSSPSVHHLLPTNHYICAVDLGHIRPGTAAIKW
jgi:hypothetical protein